MNLVAETGTLVSIGLFLSLSESIQYNEKILVALLKKEKLPIPPKYQDQTTDLSYPDF